MSAITTVLLEFLKPGDLLLFSNPVYGGTDHFIHHFLPKLGIHTMGFYPGEPMEEITKRIDDSGLKDQLALVYLETPANPTNDLVDIEAFAKLAKNYSTTEKQVVTVVDNTYMGPLWQHPLQAGADLVIYSATKYIGGHSDVIAGAVLGSTDHMKRVKTLRTFLGNMAGPWTGWLLLRSLETLKVRMEKQCANAQIVTRFLNEHPAIRKVSYLGLLNEEDAGYDIYKKQCDAPGAMLSFYIQGGEKEAFAFLNHLKLVKLAVSLGSTESLVQHPATMTHAAVDPADKQRLGITPSLIRLSVGVEHPDDLMQDLSQALGKIGEIKNGHKSVSLSKTAG